MQKRELDKYIGIKPFTSVTAHLRLIRFTNKTGSLGINEASLNSMFYVIVSNPHFDKNKQQKL